MREQIQTVAIDLDGTLLGPDHRISAANAGAIAACRAAGVEVLLATGRMFVSVRPYCVELGLAGPQITLNGGAIVDAPDGEPEPGPCMAEEVVRTIADGLRVRGVPFVVFGRNAIHALPGTTEAAVLEGYGEPKARIIPDLDRRHLPDPIKILAFAADPSGDADLNALAGDAAETVRTGGGFLEYMIPGVSKGSALAEILRRRGGVPRQATLAIGDYYNDLSMFAVAGVSVAMGNAPASVREAARFVTGPCEADGLAQALERHVLRPAGRPLEVAR